MSISQLLLTYPNYSPISIDDQEIWVWIWGCGVASRKFPSC